MTLQIICIFIACFIAVHYNESEMMKSLRYFLWLESTGHREVLSTKGQNYGNATYYDVIMDYIWILLCLKSIF